MPAASVGAAAGWAATSTSTTTTGSTSHRPDNAGAKTIYVDGNVGRQLYVQAELWNTAATGSQMWIGGSADTGDGNTPFNGLIDGTASSTGR